VIGTTTDDLVTGKAPMHLQHAELGKGTIHVPHGMAWKDTRFHYASQIVHNLKHQNYFNKIFYLIISQKGKL
jgi:hypothetical protein